MKTVWDGYSLAPYATWGRQWVGYDDVDSISLKAAYARAMGLGGAMLWSLETDDFAGNCKGGRYPLLNAVKRVFAAKEVPPLPMPSPNRPSGEGDGGSSVRPSYPTTTSRRPTTTTEKPTTRRPTTTSTTQRPTTTTQRPKTTTTYRPETEPTTRRPTYPTTTIRTTSTSESYPEPTTAAPSSTSTSKSSTSINWWPHKSSTWWPQKTSTWWPPASSAGPSDSSEVWWSSTTAAPSSTESDNPNRIDETNSSSGSEDKPSAGKFVCTESGLFRNPESCTAFIRCLETAIEGQYQLFFHTCPDKTVFNSESRLCDWVENVPECIATVPKYYLRGTFQTNFHVVTGEGARERDSSLV